MRSFKANILTGWVIITISYFLTYISSSMLYRVLFQQPIDHSLRNSGTFIGFFMLTIPYILAGIYIRRTSFKPISTAIWTSTIPCVLEKLLLLWIGFQFVKSDNQSIGAHTSIEFLRGDGGLPYFTIQYMLLGVGSILICVFLANRKEVLK